MMSGLGAPTVSDRAFPSSLGGRGHLNSTASHGPWQLQPSTAGLPMRSSVQGRDFGSEWGEEDGESHVKAGCPLTVAPQSLSVRSLQSFQTLRNV